MDQAACIDFANAHPICFLATEDQGRPRVRPLLLWFADQDGFTFMTMSPKQLSEQLHRDARVEVCFFNGAEELPDARSLRVTGAVEFLDDAELVHKVSEERAALEGLIGRPLEPIAEVFRVRHGQARFWTLHDILKERTLETIRF
jgi:pyridoxamine 5'-phosphate oxidase